MKELTPDHIANLQRRAKYVAEKWGYAEIAEEFAQEIFVWFARGRKGATIDQLFVDYLRALYGRKGSPSNRQRHLLTDLTFSLDQPVGEDGGDTLGHELIGDPGAGVGDRGDFWRLAGLLQGRDRELITLRFAEGYLEKEIAERFGVSESRVSQMLSHVLQALKKNSEGSTRCSRERARRMRAVGFRWRRGLASAGVERSGGAWCRQSRSTLRPLARPQSRQAG